MNNTPPKLMNELSILQWNCCKSNGKKGRPILDQLDTNIHLIVALQEQGYVTQTDSTYCPPGYHLLYEPGASTRVCFMISKTVDVADWEWVPYSKHVAALRLKRRQCQMTIINVYSPGDEGQRPPPRLPVWSDIEKALEEAVGEIILLGDFNAHHQRWGGLSAATHQKSNHLLQQATERGLQLTTPPGVPTWKKGNSQSVIDLTFMSQYLQDRLEYCGTVEEWGIIPDHIPILIRLDVGPTDSRPRIQYNLQKLDEKGFTEHVNGFPWQNEDDPIDTLQTIIMEGLEIFCKKRKTVKQSRHRWSPTTSVLLYGTRYARRQYNASGSQLDRYKYKLLSNKLKNSLRKDSRISFRCFIAEVTESHKQHRNEGLWRMSKWTRNSAGRAREDPHLPALRKTPADPLRTTNIAKTELLREKFFPTIEEADLSDIETDELPEELEIDCEVTAEDVEAIIRNLPSRKATGPVAAPNEILRILAKREKAGDPPTPFCENLAPVLSGIMISGHIPPCLKDSYTLAIKKPGKKDYSLPNAYRPIALENALAKILEKILAERISQIAEDHDLLPWNQMGARPGRSTLTAVHLLRSTVEAAWMANPKTVVSALGLDISGAFDNVSHERLVHILAKKGYPKWIRKIVQSFITERTTRIVYAGYESPSIVTNTGIPQGSPLSPILFLFFISELLETFQDVNNDTIGFGFVDDTTLVTWGATATENCIRLEEAHDKCAVWARRHGAKFAPDKYQIMHFTRKRKHPQEDLAATVRINGVPAELMPKCIKILGIWVDSKLQWKEHILKARNKGIQQVAAMARIAQSSWGPVVRKTKLLYTAVVRPTLLYGAQVWSTGPDTLEKQKKMLSALEAVQNRGLRTVMGAYKRTLITLLTREAGVEPLFLNARAIAGEYAVRTKNDAVIRRIQRVSNQVWEANIPRNRRRIPAPRPPLPMEANIPRSEEDARKGLTEIRKWKEFNNRKTEQARRRRHDVGPQEANRKGKILSPTRAWMDAIWRKKWKETSIGKRPTAWRTPWSAQPLTLYDGLTKAESTALFLLRTEVIGLRAWLYEIGVPDILPRCPCAYPAETVRHVLLECNRYPREDLLQSAGTEDKEKMLSQRKGAHAAARWLVESGALQQFKIAKEIDKIDLSRRRALPRLKDPMENVVVRSEDLRSSEI
jgi:hypothetical protein